VVLPILREALPDVLVVSVVPDVDYRTYPMVVISRQGGTRNPNLPNRYGLPGVGMTAVSADGLIEAEELYDDALEALYAAVRNQTVVPNLGYLQSLNEAQGATQVRSEVPDTWAVEGSLQLGLRASF
jgi:hypothetical protein